MAVNSSTNDEHYSHDVQKLLLEYSRDTEVLDNLLNGFATCMINYGRFKEEDRQALEEKLASVKKLYSNLEDLRRDSSMEIETLSYQQSDLCEELVQKVPGIRQMPRWEYFSMYHYSVYPESPEAESSNTESNDDPPARLLKVLLGCYRPSELAKILNVRLDLAEELHKSLAAAPVATDIPREHAKAVENLAAPMDPEEYDRLIEETWGKVDGIDAVIADYRKQIKDCLSVLNSAAYFVQALEHRLEMLDKVREQKRIREEEIARRSKSNLETKDTQGQEVRGFEQHHRKDFR